MDKRTSSTPADRARALGRVHRITVATGLAGAAAVVTFGGLAAISDPGSQVSTGGATTTDVTDTTDQTTSQSAAASGLQAPAQAPGTASGGGQTTTGGS